MFKTATLICIGLCLVGSQVLAGTNTQPEGTVTQASNSGLYVRVASPSTDTNLGNGNVYGSAVNTAGVTRATAAVKIGGRVFLTADPNMKVSHTGLAAVTKHRTNPTPPRKSPEGLGTLLARIFGLG